jgi:hypothetical protein
VIGVCACNLDPAIIEPVIRDMAAAKSWSPGDFEIANFDRMAEGRGCRPPTQPREQGSRGGCERGWIKP